MSFLLLKNCLIYGNTATSDILLEDGKISSIAAQIDENGRDIKVVDIGERYTLPGLIDCHTHLGIIEEGTGKIGIDNNETSNPITPQLRAIDAINPFDIAFADALKSGITAVMSSPGSENAIGGQSAAIKTTGTIIDQMIIKNPVGLKIALGENPISTYGINSKCPVTRMGTASLIREIFMKAQDYMEKKKRGTLVERDIQLEAVIPVLDGRISLRAHAHRADDIVSAIRLAEEFNISRLVIEHGTEANLVADYLKQKNVPVCFGPMLTPRIKMELKKRSYRCALELVEAGVKIAIITDHPYNSIDQLRTVTILAVTEGLRKEDAIKAITIHPAEILNCQSRIGSLREGCDGDIAIFSGDPLDINSKAIMTIINGKIVFTREGYF